MESATTKGGAKEEGVKEEEVTPVVTSTRCLLLDD
jgi:hypothetical protein